MKDAVNPSHYNKFKIQPIEFILANGLSYIQGNVVKYICRYPNKNGVEDLRKAIRYCEMAIDELERNENPMPNLEFDFNKCATRT